MPAWQAQLRNKPKPDVKKIEKERNELNGVYNKLTEKKEKSKAELEAAANKEKEEAKERSKTPPPDKP